MLKRRMYYLIAGLIILITGGCTKPSADKAQSNYKDTGFVQEYSVKFNAPDDASNLLSVAADRNGVIEVLSSTGLLKTFDGQLQYPGTLVPDKTYRPIADKKIKAIASYRNQIVYADEHAVLSNAWAGSLYARHSLPSVNLISGGDDFAFLITDGKTLQYIKDSVITWTGQLADIRQIIFDSTRNTFWIRTPDGISGFDASKKRLDKLVSIANLTTIVPDSHDRIIAGTRDGILQININTKSQDGVANTKLPWTEITCATNIGGQIWYGTTKGAFTVESDGRYKYYASRRWLPSDQVIDIAQGADSTILILTDKGLARISQKKITLYEKAMFYEKQVRNRHLRHGFNATLGYMTDGSLATGSLEDSDNDGLWTSMYLGAEVFRYAVTQAPEALENIEESMEAMERLYMINQVKGFPSRSFERRGYKYDDKPWRRAQHPEWDWKSTTSSDEAIGHIFVFGVMAEILADEDLKKRAVTLIDSVMQHTLDNDLYLVDWDGKPTIWGRWNPTYVNARPKGVGDRKINSSNYIAMLQTAYHFTKKEAYKEKAFELMTKHGYYENLMRPMKQIGKAADDADDWSKMLSESWNHSDDEMYFLGYWGLYRYALNDTLKTRFKAAIIDHWEIERPEKEGAWNIFTALTGTQDFDLNEAVWYLQEFPLDLIHWRVENSKRKDITMMEPNFRNQLTTEVLSPQELPVSRHNANRFDLDGGDGGASEYSAGDIWLLPYWMGRYLNVISKPATTVQQAQTFE